MPYRPAPRITALGEGFYDEVEAARFPKRVLRFRNQRWAERVGLGDLDEAAWERHFARFEPLTDNLRKPLALRYHGHQFGVYNPALGDGRGFLFAQLLEDAGDAVDARRARLLDLGTKGSGATPWSRGGDGRLTLKGGVREVLATEMLEALDVPTSKTFSLFETGESLYRGDEPSPTRSSVLVRLGHSHLRFGTFQRLAHLGDAPRMQKLVDHVVDNYFPELASARDVPLAVFRAVAERHADLAAAYTVSGFVHGVLNTDNMNINGESFDYGPWRFLPTLDPKFIAAYFDETGHYAYGRQPSAILWNLTRLAASLRLIAPDSPLDAALSDFEPAFDAAVQRRLTARLGLRALGEDLDGALVNAVFLFLEESGVGVDRFYFDWYAGLASEPRALASPAEAAYRGARFKELTDLFERYEPVDAARLAHPYFQGSAPCAMLIDEVEAIWSAIAYADDWGPFEAKVEAIRAIPRL